ncbi:hypothetical protein SAMN05920897_11861 [Alkalispirochaeta americana]|uniref:Transporter n=1 Tax=Alkalispirochaeta americana TaxID=159291 RepID=A0A1N6WS37_9SPIO|nr:hypothetical protein [Alkalispirochaeta americana]SIQ92842.1 hypothetical protein SAMN05920897_11861 [Alkalispirochaeta americana]
MKKRITLALAASLLVLAAGSLSGQSLKGMSLNGSTGLIGIPTGRVGWEHSSDLGFDLGHHTIFDDDHTAYINKASLSLFRLAEIAFAYDTNRGSDNEDMIISGKLQLPTQGTAVAIGGNVQLLQINGEDETVQQIYLAATYPGQFFNMPAETTVVVGKSFGDMGPGSEAIDFGMGFDLVLFPDIFQGFVHWVNDFSNFSYSWHAVGPNAQDRGAFNTGIRIDLASYPALSRYKLVIDAMMTDALDDNRAFALGIVFGAPLQ